MRTRQIQNEVKDEITEAVKFAEESPFPTPDNVTTDVLAPEQVREDLVTGEVT